MELLCELCGVGGQRRRINCVEGEAILYIDMGGRLAREAMIGVGAVGMGRVILIVMGEGIGKKVIKKIYGLDRSCFVMCCD